MLKKMFLLCLFVPCFVMGQSYVGTGNTTIITIDSYNGFGGGDIYFKVENPVPECANGYWFTKADPGFNANLSIILSAYQAKNQVLVYGLPSVPWPGSSGTICKLYSVALQ